MERQFRDPIHHFITLGPNEQMLVETREFQRLRHIHQLALTFMVYPGATHRRFEHSLGVMDLAGKIFDVVTSDQSLKEFGQIRELLPDLDAGTAALATDRATLIAAALLHDVGHMPFSHAAESLLPNGKSHESITADMVLFGDIARTIEKPKPYLRAEDVARAAVKPVDLPNDMGKQPVSDWQGVLREIVQSNIVGADRMDYLLRDAYHAGVAYGSFDIHRLVSGIRLLAYSPDANGGEKEETAPQLGITHGTLQVAEQLQIARYLMFTQVYFHRTRVAYDLHLKEFLAKTLEGGVFPDVLSDYVGISDNDVFVWMEGARKDSEHPGHEPAKRILERNHFRLVYEVSEREDQEFTERVIESGEIDEIDNRDRRFLAGKAICKELSQKYGEENVRQLGYDKPVRNSMPVLRENGRVEPAESLSRIFRDTPSPRYDYVFIDRRYREDAREWLNKHIDEILRKEAR